MVSMSESGFQRSVLIHKDSSVSSSVSDAISSPTSLWCLLKLAIYFHTGLSDIDTVDRRILDFPFYF
jgi:hypothetical protein